MTSKTIPTSHVLTVFQQPAKKKTGAEQVSEERRQCRVERYNEVVALHRKGMNQTEIGRTLHMGRKMFRRMIRVGQFPERAKPHRGPPGKGIGRRRG
jgi:hypothetical protein